MSLGDPVRAIARRAHTIVFTPPVGTVLNVVAGVGKLKINDLTRGLLPFMVAEFGVKFLMVFFPGSSLGRPNGSRTDPHEDRRQHPRRQRHVRQ